MKTKPHISNPSCSSSLCHRRPALSVCPWEWREVERDRERQRKVDNERRTFRDVESERERKKKRQTDRQR
jgi:hypothetical protein